MPPLQRRAYSLLAFAALTLPCGIAVHLIAEAAALGAQDRALIFSARHVYLWIILVATLGTFAACFARSASRDRAALMLLVDGLPARTARWPFAMSAFVGQALFFIVTESLEGAPLSQGNIALGICAAAIASSVGALAIAWADAPLGRIVLALAGFLGSMPPRVTADRYGIDRRYLPLRPQALRDARRACRPPPPRPHSALFAAR